MLLSQGMCPLSEIELELELELEVGSVLETKARLGCFSFLLRYSTFAA